MPDRVGLFEQGTRRHFGMKGWMGMAKKAKTKKTATAATAKKKESAGKPKAVEDQPDLAVKAETPQAEAPIEVAESVASEPQKAAVPVVAPSVAVATRKKAAVPVAVPEAPVEQPAPVVASPEPMAAEPPLTGILAILNVKSEADTAVSVGNLATYRAYLEKVLEKPIRVCGREPFGWERPYAWGLRDRAAYEARKAACPSFTDDLEILGFDEEVDSLDGIGVRAKRLADGKEFSLLLASLKSGDSGSKNAEILDDFAAWFCKNR